ncbi:hypothetical protein TorRG33x02_164880 [Trema orientale]|uniref:Uncharacterized protein n=1 Tax=Trema orientale TaxID=63057 RepID=A0A2P5EQF5_TREOI|nr:hypothetical protein TorRG33x02_164880 [Trema orientale]
MELYQEVASKKNFEVVFWSCHLTRMGML